MLILLISEDNRFQKEKMPAQRYSAALAFDFLLFFQANTIFARRSDVAVF
jgi:hypothetical protein